MSLLTAFLAGLLFGSGLVLSGMTNPAKVLAFLDVTGQWDPSLAFVMLGAILVAAVGFRFAGARARPLFGASVHLPGAKRIDARLVAGSAVFGIGWGLVGYCPGPALAALAVGGRPTLIFVAAMVAGMALFEVYERVRSAHAPGMRPPATSTGE
jgi:uncharacterized membrane protein YedE/YeeE